MLKHEKPFLGGCESMRVAATLHKCMIRRTYVGQYLCLHYRSIGCTLPHALVLVLVP